MLDPLLLPSGARLLAEERRDSPSFTFSLNFPFGSRNEALRKEGFVHFMEHMLFKGTWFRNAKTLWADIERTGGYANGYTDRDSLCLQATVPSSHWRTGLDFLLEAAFASALSEEEFEREKKVVLAEILQVEDEPEENAFDAFLAWFWEGDGAGRPIAGTRAQVEAISRDELAAFYRAAIVPGAAILAASGPIPLPALVEAATESIEKASAASGRDRESGGIFPEPFLLPTTPPRPREGTRVAPSKRAEQVYFYDANQLKPPAGSEDYAGRCLASSILGEASTSRLFSRLREKEGLVYSVQSALSSSRTEDLLLVQALCGEGDLPACASMVEEERAKFLESGPTEEEFLDARTRLAGSFALSLEDPDARVRRMVHWYLCTGSLPSVEEELKIYADAPRSSLDKALADIESAPRGRFAYGKIGPRSRAALGTERR